MISAVGAFKAQSNILNGRMVHGTKSIMVLIVVNILFFILIISFQPFQMRHTQSIYKLLPMAVSQ